MKRGAEGRTLGTISSYSLNTTRPAFSPAISRSKNTFLSSATVFRTKGREGYTEAPSSRPLLSSLQASYLRLYSLYMFWMLFLYSMVYCLSMCCGRVLAYIPSAIGDPLSMIALTYPFRLRSMTSRLGSTSIIHSDKGAY